MRQHGSGKKQTKRYWYVDATPCPVAVEQDGLWVIEVAQRANRDGTGGAPGSGGRGGGGAKCGRRSLFVSQRACEMGECVCAYVCVRR